MSRHIIGNQLHLDGYVYGRTEWKKLLGVPSAESWGICSARAVTVIDAEDGALKVVHIIVMLQKRTY